MPLAIPPGRKCFVATCDVCGAIQDDLDETEIEHADGEARSLGWLPFPRRGQKREGWEWRCPACVPSRSNAGMPSTPVLTFFPPTGDDKPPPDSDD